MVALFTSYFEWCPPYLQVNGTEETHELLCILDFNNVRKRMSVILRKDGHIRLYCKGADSIIYERLKEGQNALKHHTQEHLNVRRTLKRAAWRILNCTSIHIFNTQKNESFWYIVVSFWKIAIINTYVF